MAGFAGLPARHVVHQGKVAASLGGTALRALKQRLRPPALKPAVIPGRELTARVPAAPRALVRDYVRHVGGDPAAYARTVPPHLFPQWAFPVAARTLREVPYPLLKIINAGCRLTVNAPLPAGEPLEVRAQLVGLEDNGHRVALRQRIVTGSSGQGDAVIAEVRAVVATGARETTGAPPRARGPDHLVPVTGRELAFWRLGADAGLVFALLTGDFNPIHWMRPYARAFGFKSAVLHGFSTMARTMEGLHRALFAGSVTRLRTLDVRFVRPLLLPARVGLYVDGHDVAVGEGPGAPAYLVGTFEESPHG
jgi:acyl dehydratase